MGVRFKSAAALNAALPALRLPAPRGTSKYGSRKMRWQGQQFDSAAELADYRDLCAQQLMGAIRSVVRQVSLPLPGSTRRIRVDFLVVENDGRIRWLDSKGFDTATGRLKRQQVREAYGIEIELVRRSARGS